MMNEKMKAIFNSTKKKAMVATACGAMVIGVGSSAVFASSNSAKSKLEKGHTSVQDEQKAAKAKMLVKNENGIITHSTDGGKTTYSTDGGKTWKNGSLEGISQGNFLFKKENGKLKISTDGGKTWVDRTPKDVEVPKNSDSSTDIKNEIKDITL